MRRHSFVVVVLISLLSLLVSCTHNSPPTPSPIENTFNGIIALSATNVWAVGGMTASDGMHVLIEHWDGNRWQANSPSIHGILCSVVALSAKDMWAVGEDIYLGSCNGTGIARHANDTLTLHWDGKTWSRIPVPALETISNYLDSVSAISSRDVWSVGNVRSYNGAVIIHWDGKNWNVVLQPHAFPFQIARLTSVKAISSSDVWIVGEYTAPEGGVRERWWNTGMGRIGGSFQLQIVLRINAMLLMPPFTDWRPSHRESLGGGSGRSDRCVFA